MFTFTFNTAELFQETFSSPTRRNPIWNLKANIRGPLKKIHGQCPLWQKTNKQKHSKKPTMHRLKFFCTRINPYFSFIFAWTFQSPLIFSKYIFDGSTHAYTLSISIMFYYFAIPRDPHPGFVWLPKANITHSGLKHCPKHPFLSRDRSDR